MMCGVLYSNICNPRVLYRSRYKVAISYGQERKLLITQSECLDEIRAFATQNFVRVEEKLIRKLRNITTLSRTLVDKCTNSVA